MSKLFKSKFLLGVMVLAVMFVTGFAVKAQTASAASCTTFTMTLKYGMRNSQVLCLQQMLNEKGFHVDGVSAGSPGMETTYFGNATKSAVMSMQATLGLTADGIFGPMSRAALMAHGYVSGNFPAGCSSASGYSSTTGLPCNAIPSTFPAGCTSTNGYSMTTGLRCDGMSSPSTVPGCAVGAAYSSTTGAPCVTTNTPTGTNGYLNNFASDSTNRVSTVYESETDKVVAGFRATARLADQTVNRVRVTFANTDTGSSANLGRYITGASLWMGTTKLATIAVADADRNTSTDLYTFNFSGLNAKVSKDTIGRFYVSVNANGSIDTNDTSATWTVSFTDGGVLYSSPDGSSDTVMDSGAITVTNLMFNKFSANGVKATLGLAATNPVSSVVTVQDNTNITSGVELLKFTIKATATDLTVRKMPIQVTSSAVSKTGTIAVTTANTTVTGTSTLFTTEFAVGDIITDTDLGTSRIVTAIASDTSLTVNAVWGSIDASSAYTGAADVRNVINTVKLYRDGNLVDSLDGSTVCEIAGTSVDLDDCTSIATPTAVGYVFSNLSDPYNKIASGITATYSVVVDLKGTDSGDNYVEGTVLSASFTNGDVVSATDLAFSVQDMNGDQLTRTSTYRVGSAVGNVMTLQVNGVQVTMGAATVTTVTDNGDTTQVTWSIPLTATAFGNTLYVGQAALLADVATGTTTSAKAFSYSFEDSSSPALHVNSCTSCVTTLSSSDALVEGNGFRLDSGAARHFTLSVTMITPTTATASYRVVVNQIRSFTESTLTSGAANQDLVPEQSYQTGYTYITG